MFKHHNPKAAADGPPSSTHLAGAHMNAAVSLTMCTFGRLAWKMLPLYIFSQFLGSFLAAGTIYAIYYGEGHSAQMGKACIVF